jgi:hypothetical protein
LFVASKKATGVPARARFRSLGRDTTIAGAAYPGSAVSTSFTQYDEPNGINSSLKS